MSYKRKCNLILIPLASHFGSCVELHVLLYVSIDWVASVAVVRLVGIVCQLVKDKTQIVIIVLGNIYCSKT